MTVRAGRPALIEHVRSRMSTDGLSVALWGPAGVGKTWTARALLPDAVVIDARALPDRAALLRAIDDVTAPALIIDGLDAWLDEIMANHLARWLAGGSRHLVTTHRHRWMPSFAQAVAVAALDKDDALELLLTEIDRRHGPTRPDADEQTALKELLPALDGLPRAIEWAAARWGVLGTSGLVARLSDRLPDELVADVTEQLHVLDDAPRRVLAGLTVFAASFSPDDVQAVLGSAFDEDVVLMLGALHDTTLLHRVAPGQFQVPRAVSQALRADGPLDEGIALRHAEWCLARHPDPDRKRAAASDVPDLIAASRRLVERGDSRVGNLLVALAAAAPGQHLELAEAAKQAAPSPAVHRALSRILRLQGRPAEAVRTLREGLALAGADQAEAGPVWRYWGVLHQSQGDWAEARTGYEQSLACAKAIGDIHGVAIATANLGTIDHDRCVYEDAERRYAEALTGLRAAQDPPVELTVRANQAVLWQELGKLDQAEPAYRQVLLLLERARHPHMMAITHGNLGLLLHEKGRLEEAEAELRLAIEQLAPIEDPKTESLCLARLAAVHADRGQRDAADRAFQAASWAVQRGDPVTQKVVDLFGAFVDLAHQRDAAATARLDAAEAVLQWSGDARIAARMLRTRSAAAPATLKVQPDGYVPPGHDPVDLSRHASLRRMFHALVETARDPGSALDVDALFAAGWPDETISPESMRNRVHVNLAKLRRWGLRTFIERNDEGYRLQATVVDG